MTAPSLHLLVLHGVLLDSLGTREPHIYGTTTLDALNAQLVAWGAARGVAVTTRQSADEGALVTAVQTAGGQYDAVVLNPGGYTHTSVALRDAVAASTVPVIEVHISNLAAREPFRAHSLIAPVARGTIMGLGVAGYTVALEAAWLLCADLAAPVARACHGQG